MAQDARKSTISRKLIGAMWYSAPRRTLGRSLNRSVRPQGLHQLKLTSHVTLPDPTGPQSTSSILGSPAADPLIGACFPLSAWDNAASQVKHPADDEHNVGETDGTFPRLVVLFATLEVRPCPFGVRFRMRVLLIINHPVTPSEERPRTTKVSRGKCNQTTYDWPDALTTTLQNLWAHLRLFY